MGAWYGFSSLQKEAPGNLKHIFHIPEPLINHNHFSLYFSIFPPKKIQFLKILLHSWESFNRISFSVNWYLEDLGFLFTTEFLCFLKVKSIPISFHKHNSSTFTFIKGKSISFGQVNVIVKNWIFSVTVAKMVEIEVPVRGFHEMGNRVLSRGVKNPKFCVIFQWPLQMAEKLGLLRFEKI